MLAHKRITAFLPRDAAGHNRGIPSRGVRPKLHTQNQPAPPVYPIRTTYLFSRLTVELSRWLPLCSSVCLAGFPLDEQVPEGHRRAGRHGGVSIRETLLGYEKPVTLLSKERRAESAVLRGTRDHQASRYADRTHWTGSTNAGRISWNATAASTWSVQHHSQQTAAYEHTTCSCVLAVTRFGDKIFKAAVSSSKLL